MVRLPERGGIDHFVALFGGLLKNLQNYVEENRFGSLFLPRNASKNYYFLYLT